MPYTFTLSSEIPASAREVYDAWLDSHGHSEMTGGEAVMSGQIGGAVSAWDGYIRGRNLELVPGARIVQSWRTTEFTEEHEDSIVTVTFEDVPGGTLLTLQHANVPDGHRSYERSGWQSHYFEPMQVYFAGHKRGAAVKSRKRAATKAAGKKAKRLAARTKTSRKKHKTKRKAAAKALGKRAKKAKRMRR